MTARTEFIERMRLDVANVKQQGLEVIKVDVLDRYLEQSLTEVPPSEQDRQLWHERDLEWRRQTHEGELELFRSVLSFGQAALKAAMVINGAAAGGLLALFGSDKLSPASARQLADGVEYFAFGVLAGAAGFGLAYIAQGAYHRAFRGENEFAARVANCFTLLCVGSFALSMMLFSAGTLRAHFALLVL